MKKFFTLIFSFLFISGFLWAGGNHNGVKTKGATSHAFVKQAKSPNLQVQNRIGSSTMDTVFFEDFESDTVLPDQNSTNIKFINIDEDGLADANARPQDWYWTETNKNDVNGCLDTSETIGVAASSSWLQGFLPGNRNSLAFQLTNVSDSTYFSFTEAPRQTPRYVDGMTVLVSPDGQTTNPNNDTLIQLAQYISGGGPVGDTSYVFGPGMVHDLGYIGPNGCWFGETANTDSGAGWPIFIEHVFDLSSYQGQTIWVIFYHDSDDDNYIQIDDILVTAPQPSTGLSATKKDFYMKAFPNPASDQLNIEFMGSDGVRGYVDLMASSGAVVKSMNLDQVAFGFRSTSMDVSDLPSGVYFLKMQLGDRISTSKVVIE